MTLHACYKKICVNDLTVQHATNWENTPKGKLRESIWSALSQVSVKYTMEYAAS